MVCGNEKNVEHLQRSLAEHLLQSRCMAAVKVRSSLHQLFHYYYYMPEKHSKTLCVDYLQEPGLGVLQYILATCTCPIKSTHRLFEHVPDDAVATEQCTQLSGRLRHGCAEFVCDGDGEGNASLIDHLMNFLDDPTQFRTWIKSEDARMCLDLDDDFVDMIVMWLRFAHLGTITPETPSWFVLAWAGFPYDANAIRDLLASQGDALLVEWLRRYVADPSRFEGWLKWWCRMWFQSKSNHAAFHAALGWIRCSAAEILPYEAWYLHDHHRDDSFHKLRQWVCTEKMGGHSTVRRRHSYRHFASMGRASLKQVLGAERQIKCRLPADLRRVLLEIGDVGEAFFGRSILSFDAVFKGQWQLTSAVIFTEDMHASFDYEEMFSGSLYLGGGGGGYASQVLMVLDPDSPQRGHVWIEDQDWCCEYNTIVPLSHSHWNWTPLKSAEMRRPEYLWSCRSCVQMSDIVTVLFHTGA